MRSILSCASALVALSCSIHAFGASQINAGTKAWADAARTGRADMLLLGDSIVNYGGGGWSSGIASAANSSIGLSGSGVLAVSGGGSTSWTNYAGARLFHGAPTDGTSANPALAPSGRYLVAGALNYLVATGQDPVKLDRFDAMDFHVVATGLSGAAQLQASRSIRFANTSQTTVQTSGVVAVAPPGSPYQDHVFSFGAIDPAGESVSFNLTAQSKDTAVHYVKVTEHNSTGIAITGWNDSGGTTRHFRDAYYNDGRFTADGRNAFYQSIVAGNSGMLNVGIAFNVNDVHLETAEGFGQQIRGLIADVRRDWAAAGLNAANLSFTLIGSYQPNKTLYGTDFDKLGLQQNVLADIAASDSQVSFIDMWNTAPQWQDAVASGLLADQVHPSDAGTQLYGQLVLQGLLPEPSTLAALAIGGAMLRRRRAV